MSSLCRGMPPSRLPVSVVCAAMVCLAFAMAGCASQKVTRQTDARPDPSIVARADTEADGQPAQPPPPISIRAAPDDPREPWSRNYGTVPPVRGVDAPVAPPAVLPAALPPVRPSPVVPAVPAASPPGLYRTAASTMSVLPPDLPPDFRRKLAEAGYH